MYSQCPECQTRFRVTADALRAAHGTVRCGRCGIAFDAVATLSDTVPPVREAGATGPVDDAGSSIASTPAGTAAAEYHFTADDLEKVFIDARDWQKQFGPETAGDAAGPQAETVAETFPDRVTEAGSEPVADATVVEVDESEPIEDITLEGERISIEVPPDWPSDEAEPDDLESTDEFEVLSEVPESAYPEEDQTDEAPGLVMVGTDEREPLLGALPEIEPAPAPEPAAPVEAEARAPATLTARRWRQPTSDESPTAVADAVDRERSSWRTFLWGVGCLLLALVLLAQLTHYYRQDLVRHPQLGPVLRQVYDRVGLPLSPNWDLAAFELRQWGSGGGPDANGRMSVRASLTNRAGFAQPHPILRLELEDRFGESIAVREFEPREYLKDPSEASRMLGPGASSEADLEIADPGREAVGYQLDVCLRETAALLRCAQGPG